MEKAYLSIRTPEANASGTEVALLRFQFNPKEYTLQKSASWKTNEAKSPRAAPTTEFQGTEPASMSLEIFLDASESKSPSIEGDIEKLMMCVKPLPQTVKSNHPSPPVVLFGWDKARLRAVVKQVQVKYTMFTATGKPTRAVCTIQLQEAGRVLPKQNPSSGGLTSYGSHVVSPGDSLASISHTEYGTPSLWRALAIANRIDDPMRLRDGSTILVPSVADAAGLA